ncbi:aminotransferase class IV [Hamadaea sp. NPDC051192]|uniref:aminotransferase class IV n=1 Tax=Hamadaea sp. NPDC051192 TaxID=3154940 RepID=UPI003430031C
MTVTVLAVLGRGLVDPATPVLRADDLGLLRGDGVFEAVHVRGGEPWMLDEHLARLARSAARMELPLPAPEALRDLIDQVCARVGPQEHSLRLICTRGSEEGGDPTFLVLGSPVGAVSINARDTGVRVRTATLGYAVGARTPAPWLLGGVKSLSYAINMASQRWAWSQGADDVVWVSADDYVLEAPTATVVWRDGSRLLTVPSAETGILAGTTARHLLDQAGEFGLTAGEELITPAGLVAADGAWLISSIRGVAELRAIDGQPLGPSPLTADIRRLLGF